MNNISSEITIDLMTKKFNALHKDYHALLTQKYGSRTKPKHYIIYKYCEHCNFSYDNNCDCWHCVIQRRDE